MTVVTDRQLIRPLLEPTHPADALTAYYALLHDEKRTRLTVGRDRFGKINSFVAVCQTGMDLFRPLVVMRAAFTSVAQEILKRALAVGRPYYVVAPPSFTHALNVVLDVHEHNVNQIYQARRASFKPVINVLVVGSRNSEGKPRFAIRSASGDIIAEAGLNWQSDEFAEVYVTVQPAARGRGLGRSVASACTSYVLEAGLRPLYITHPENVAAVRLCHALGYTDTGATEYTCVGVCRA